MSAVDRLIALALASIEQASTGYLAGGSRTAWEREMQRIVATAATATYLTATAQRLGLSPDSDLFKRNRLTRAERADVTSQVNAQLAYLNKFLADIQAGNLSPAQIAARANLYAAGTVRTFYYQTRWGDWDIPQQLYPGQQTCQGACKCSISVIDNGDGSGVLTRVLGGEQHCKECPRLAGDHPVKRRRAA